ncbi:MAG: hypothetical protein ISN29_07535 [Gammaproteobacteria bacterium AqS3]|nr:hypothetical protein [Gammaproteobacteria bacterium AqS3]
MNRLRWGAALLGIGLLGIALHLVKPLLPFELISARWLGLYWYEIAMFWVSAAAGAGLVHWARSADGGGGGGGR